MASIIRFESTGLQEMQDVIDDISGPPDFEVIGGLETAHAAAFADTQARVASPVNQHTDWFPTGSLKASARISTDFDGKVWEGTITYGGPTTGPNNPVDYALYEAARGGVHDFFGGLAEILPLYEKAVAKKVNPK